METNVFMFDLFKRKSRLCRERKDFRFLQGRIESRTGGFYKVWTAFYFWAFPAPARVRLW